MGAVEAGDDTAHGGRSDLFGVGEFPEGSRAAKDENRKRGKLGGADAAFAVANAKAAKQVNCGGMKLIGEIHRHFVQGRRSCNVVGSGIRAGGLERGGGSRLARAFFALDRGHEI